MAFGDVTWEPGVITVPSSTGNVVVTGLSGTPSAVLFFGTNWTVEDTIETTNGIGVFRGIASTQWDSPSTILQTGTSVIPAGDAHYMETAAINMLTFGAAALYQAHLTSFDANGFTVNFNVAASGGYKVAYVAMMNPEEVGAAFTSGGQFNSDLTWKVGAMLMNGAWGGPQVYDADMSRDFFGGAAYPGTAGGGSWFGAGLTAFTFPGSIGAQYDIGVYNNAPGTLITHSGEFIGPALTTSNVTAEPTGAGFTTFDFNTHVSNNEAFFVAWDDEASQTGIQSPTPANTGNTSTVSGLPFSPGLVIGYTIGDEPQGQGTGGRGSIGFSMATENFQWCALSERVTTGGFQSFQRGFVDHVTSTDVHAGTITLTDDGFVVETEEDGASAQNWVWHAFGSPSRRTIWTPHIYRRVFG